MKEQLASKANEINALCEYVKTQSQLFEKTSRGIQQITEDYLLANNNNNPQDPPEEQDEIIQDASGEEETQSQ